MNMATWYEVCVNITSGQGIEDNFYPNAHMIFVRQHTKTRKSIPYFEAKELGILPMLREILGHPLEQSPVHVARRANAEAPQPAPERPEEPQHKSKTEESQ